MFDATTQPAPTTAAAMPTTPAISGAPDTTVSVEVAAEPPPGPASTAPRTTIGAGAPTGTAGDDDAADGTGPPPTSAADNTAAACNTAACSGPQIVAYPSLTAVPQLGDDPVRGSGCGLAEEFGNTIPDGLYFGLLYPSADEVSFDVACAYFGDSAVDKGADPGPASDFYPVNVGTRERDVPLAADFVYRVGTWTADGQCVDAGPAGNADWATADDGTSAWLTIAGGDATGAIAMCPI